uniref:Uncharacterized protein n=1 Tax=Arundo donax TaxID=35708 RepID=A0A0A9EL21_ARUDO
MLLISVTVESTLIFTFTVVMLFEDYLLIRHHLLRSSFSGRA